eukprot:1158636-Pelagomonas_calceolata.AAC.3
MPGFSFWCTCTVLLQVRLFPNQLRSMVAPAHLLAGQYAHAVEEWDYAVAHFQVSGQGKVVKVMQSLLPAMNN